MASSPKKKKVPRNAAYDGRSKEEVLITAAKHSLKRFGVVLPTQEMLSSPPKYVPAVKSVMSDQQLLLAASEASLRQFGSLHPPRDVLDQLMDKTCPKCGETKMIIDGFGLKMHGGEVLRPQSWCLDCRSGPEGRARR
jgi:hypothetical protein